MPERIAGMAVDHITFHKLAWITLGLATAVAALYTLSYQIHALQVYFVPLVVFLVAIWSVMNMIVLDPLVASRHKSMLMVWLVIVLILALQAKWMQEYAFTAIPISLIVLLLSAISLMLHGLLGRAHLFLQGSVLHLVFDSFAVVLSAILVLFISVITAPAAVPPEPLSSSEELQYLLEMDQEDRISGRIWLQPQRDEVRLRRVLKINEENGIQTSLDKYRAALVLNHGSCPEHYELAYELANQAANSGVEGASGLAREVYNRWLLSRGQHRMYEPRAGFPFGRTCPG